MREMSCWWHFLLHILTIGSSEKEEKGKLELMQRWKELGWRWQLRISTESRGDPILTIGSSERKPRSSRVFKVFGSPSLEKCFTLIMGSNHWSCLIFQWNFPPLFAQALYFVVDLSCSVLFTVTIRFSLVHCCCSLNRTISSMNHFVQRTRWWQSFPNHDNATKQ